MAEQPKYETILSLFDEKLTLLQWLKKVEEELGHAPTTADLEALKDTLELEIAQKEDATHAEDTYETIAHASEQYGILEGWLGQLEDGGIPEHQATFTFIVDPLTNINGRVLSAYEATEQTISGHQALVITKGGNACTKAEAKAYMRYMCGSDFLPTYAYEIPKNSIFVDSDLNLYKPQWDENTYGLALFSMGALPTGGGGTQLYKSVIHLGEDDGFSIDLQVITPFAPNAPTSESDIQMLINNVKCISAWLDNSMGYEGKVMSCASNLGALDIVVVGWDGALHTAQLSVDPADFTITTTEL